MSATRRGLDRGETVQFADELAGTSINSTLASDQGQNRTIANITVTAPSQPGQSGPGHGPPGATNCGTNTADDAVTALTTTDGGFQDENYARRFTNEKSLLTWMEGTWSAKGDPEIDKLQYGLVVIFVVCYLCS